MIFHAVVLICNISVPVCQTVELPMTFPEIIQCIKSVQAFEHGSFIGSPEGSLIKRSECFNDDQYNDFVKTNKVIVLPLPEKKQDSNSNPNIPNIPTEKPVIPSVPEQKVEPEESMKL